MCNKSCHQILILCLSIEAIEETKFEEGAGKIRPINEDGSSGVTSDGTAPAHTNGTPSNEEIAQKQSQAYSWEVQSETNLELAALVNYITPVRFKSFEDAHKKNRSYEMSSLSETTAAAHLKQNPVEFVNYNKRQLTRVYPKGSRYDSSNYMPQVFWNTGCQIVALNFQTYDVPFQLHLGKFEFNKSCGYLLKPVCMRRPDKEFDPFVESPMDGVVAATLKVKIISGQMLCGHRCGTYVELEMYGLPTDTVRRRYKTRTVQSTQMNTVWNEEQWVFKKVVVPELVMLRFAVYDDGNRFLSQRVIPLTAIQAGYRHIPLRNELNQPIDYATLFVLFEVSDYIPDGMADFLAALSNPIAYQSAVQKRAKQLEELYDDDEEQEGGGEQLPTASTSSIPNETDPKSSKVLSTSFSSNLTTSDAGSPESYDIRNAYTLTRDSSDASNKIQSLNLDEAEATTSKETVATVDDLKDNKDFKKVEKKHSSELQNLEKKQAKSLTALKRVHDRELGKWKDAQATAKSKKDEATLDMLEAQLKELMDRHGAQLHQLEQQQADEMRQLKKQHTQQEYKILNKLMALSQTAQLKRLDSRHMKESQLEHRKSSKDMLDEVQKFKDKQKDKVSDKEEMDRILREYRNKLAKQTAERRNNLTEQQQSERKRFLEDYERRLQQFKEDEAKSLASFQRDANASTSDD
ncbi:1-phosphatidylinositol 4,5-bisphosphate phosphodiesterase beta-1-like [Corticium candelabrum]|uniref:1-phosphatidylinositol 4,5-bisphosphate phosphodiesterase beta-1-like n=1 Tax=Corticium candelabrum TaxID=121492 RepID=UPI002E262A1E|nr:1-phosphatidylinositol 4,5-bisphosphate phosphodiesterase beta-1-like [Corticium candelabrum]